MKQYPYLTLISLIFFVLSFSSCGKKTEEQERIDLKAANDQIKFLNEQIQILKSTNQPEKLKETYEQRFSTQTSTYEQKIANLQENVADLQIKLGVSEKQRIALQEIVDQSERIPFIQKNNFNMERVIWIILIFICILGSCFYAVRYHELRKQRRDNIVRIISELSRNGVSHE